MYNSKVDIYALGLVFFELKYPFSTMMERVMTLQNIKKHKYPERFVRELPEEVSLAYAVLFCPFYEHFTVSTTHEAKHVFSHDLASSSL